MTAGTLTPYRSEVRTGRDGFAQLVRAEWTKFRTVRGWVIGMIVAALATVGFGWLTGSGSQCSTMGVSHGHPVSLACTSPLGPGGEAVTDQFYFVHQALASDGSITVRMTSLTSGALQPWAKAGIIIKASTKQGSAYAAMLVTGSHGVRMQWNYTQDTAGLPGAVSAAAPRWLRLTRSGDTITGYDSADGARWTEVGAATLAGLPSTVQAGLFATTPHSDTSGHVRAGSDVTTATGGFDHVSRQGAWPGGAWTGADIADIGAGPLESGADGFQQAGAGFTVTGHGDIAPAVPPDSTATPIGLTLDGVFAGLIAVIVIGAMFITAEYRRGLIRTTLAASPGRGRVLAAKAIVVAVITFVTGLAAVVVAIPVAEHALRAGGNFIAPLPVLTELRVVVGTAALLALVAVLALAAGAILRSSAGAITAVIAAIVLPYFVAVASPVLSGAAADWLVRITPAVAFAIQQTVPQYAQVSATYTPFNGYFPLAPLAGFAVLCGWTAVALGLAVFLLRRRDA